MKTCRTCNQHKPADAYRGTRSACRECESARRREWYAASNRSDDMLASMAASAMRYK